MKHKSPVRKLANEIARKLFTCGGGARATQLRLMQGERYLCGWGEEPMAATIAILLDQAGVELKPKSRRSK